MKNKGITAVVLTLAVLATSCEKKLEVIPAFQQSEERALATIDGMDGALNFAYQILHTNLSRTSIIWPELIADHLFYRGTFPSFQYYYNRQLDVAANEPASSTDARLLNGIILRNTYICINVGSILIRAVNEGYAKDDIPWETNKDRIKGEGYFLRAASHFDLVRFYGQQWDPAGPNTAPGIILNEGVVNDRDSQVKKRATVAEVYANIISDLKQAETLLPDTYIAGVHTVNYLGRTYKDAATAMLARVYFQQQDYVKAKEAIDRLIGTTAGAPTKHALESSLTQIYLSRGATSQLPENIFQTTNPTAVNGLSAYWNSGTPVIYGAFASTTADATASANFVTDAKFAGNDQRLVLLFKTGTDGRLIPNKYSLTAQFSQPLIRTAEMLLDRAEINARANNLQDAIKDVNLIRGRAQIGTLPTTITQAPLIDSILVERIRELAFEGDRLWNLKRLKLQVAAAERPGKGPLEWNSKDLLMKYSSEEMDKNPLLENNN